MIVKKALTLLVAAAAVATAVAVCVVAAAMALYALLRGYLTPAGAAAAVAGAAALIAVIGAFVALGKTHLIRRKAPAPEESLTTRLIGLVKERPLVAAGAVAAAAVVAIRNPRILSIILSAALASSAPTKPKPKR